MEIGVAPVGEDRLVERSFIRPFRTISNGDVASVGGKNASLGEMYRALVPLGVRIPNGFAVTADAYREVVTKAGLWSALHEALDGLDPSDLTGPMVEASAASDWHAPEERKRVLPARHDSYEHLFHTLRVRAFGFRSAPTGRSLTDCQAKRLSARSA